MRHSQICYSMLIALAVLSPSPALSQQAATGSGDEIGSMPTTDAEQQAIARARAKADSDYQRALKAMMPLTPDQIRETQKEVKARKRALRDTPSPVVQSRTVRVDLGPGTELPRVHVSPRYGAALTVLDATGKPWPINAVTVADPKAFQVMKPVDEGPGSSVLTVVPLIDYAHTNMIVMLKGLATPVIVRLKVSDSSNNDRLDVVVNGRGPNAIAPVASRKLSTPDNPTMRYLLDGVPPKNARRVEIKGGPAEGWIVDDAFYLRTRMSVISPAWVSSLSGSGDVTVYELPILPTVVASDSDGQTVDLELDSSALIDGALASGATTLGSMQYGPDAATH